VSDQPALVARPPRDWEVQTVAVLGAVAAAALLGMVLFVSDLVLRSYVTSNGASGLSPMVRGVVNHADAIDLLFLLLVFAYIGGFFVWRHHTQRMLQMLGDATGTATQHWTVMAWNLAVGAAFLIRLNAPSSGDDLATSLGIDAVQMGVRLIGIALLLFGVWQIRAQVRQAVADLGIVMRIGDIARPSAMPNRPLAPVARDAAPAVDGLPAADDEFWGEVRRTATGQRADLALLESTGTLVHRWMVIPENGDVTAVRAALAPGAVVTVFIEPPAATETKNFAPSPADEYHGFLEDAESGALWYQRVVPKRVPAFLARARSARRWSLYPVGDPNALTAVAPAGLVATEPA
jgi:hypothetical protein